MWESGNRYRGRAVPGEFMVKTNESTGTTFVEGLIEVTIGPMLGERIRWRGYVNSQQNVDISAAELIAMGWRSVRWGDWSGIGSKEIVFTCMSDEGTNGKRYFRASFVRDLPTTSEKGRASDAVVAALNQKFGMSRAVPANGSLPRSAETAAAPVESEEIPF